MHASWPSLKSTRSEQFTQAAKCGGNRKSPRQCDHQLLSAGLHQQGDEPPRRTSPAPIDLVGFPYRKGTPMASIASAPFVSLADSSSDCPVSRGQIFQFSYPENNRFRKRTRLERRRFVVQGIRDLERRPLSPVTLDRDPDLRRCRFLLCGHDLDKHEWRCFYLDSWRTVRKIEIPLQQLWLYDPLTDCRVERVGPLWTDSREDLARVRSLIRQFNEYATTTNGVNLLLGSFPSGVRS